VNINKLKEMGIGFRPEEVDVSPDRPTLVMIHGAGGSSQIWQNQVRQSKTPSGWLSRSINALALDLPGHGESGGQAMSDIDAYAGWLKEVLSAVCDEPPFVMGHSMGGAIVQKMALSSSDLVKGLILVGTGPRLLVAPVFLKGLQENFHAVVDTIMGAAYGSGADARLIQEGAKLMKAAGAEAAYSDFYACNQFDLRDRVAAIDLPCLILCGSEDKLTPPSLSQKLHASIRKSRMAVIPEAGHMVMIEKFREFNDQVLDFVLNP
jgi:pimeloyl-ACP methyl ester carboxylesterase